jgi:hypothetical protein
VEPRVVGSNPIAHPKLSPMSRAGHTESKRKRLIPRYNSSYTPVVKTAVSIPDPVFAEAERVSQRLRMSRSRLYTVAVENFLRSHRSKGVKEALDAVYATEPSQLSTALAAMQLASLPREEW